MREAAFLNPTSLCTFFQSWVSLPLILSHMIFILKAHMAIFSNSRTNGPRPPHSQGETWHKDIKTICAFPSKTQHWRLNNTEGWNKNTDSIIRLGERISTPSLYTTYIVEKHLSSTAKLPLMTLGWSNYFKMSKAKINPTKPTIWICSLLKEGTFQWSKCWIAREEVWAWVPALTEALYMILRKPLRVGFSCLNNSVQYHLRCCRVSNISVRGWSTQNRTLGQQLEAGRI